MTALTRRLVLALALLAIAPATAAACSCASGGARAAASRSAAVYLGRVLSIGVARPDRFGEVGTARLAVTQAIKGVATTDTVSVEFPSSNSCNPDFRVGREYLVFAVRIPAREATLGADICTGTKTISCAAHDLRELGATVPRRVRDCFPVVKLAPRPSRPAT
jgi:hypothetical protein